MSPQNPNLRRTERSLPIALLRAREQVMGPIREMLASSGINEQKWRVLRVVDEQGPLEQTAISQAACLMLPSLSRILQTMETEGLITRQADNIDRRKSIVTLTDAGRALIEAHAEKSGQLLTKLETRFGPERLNVLLNLLDDLRKLDLSD
jgi:homoprotocatechuate degradation regulator HpaR